MTAGELLEVHVAQLQRDSAPGGISPRAGMPDALRQRGKRRVEFFLQAQIPLIGCFLTNGFAGAVRFYGTWVFPTGNAVVKSGGLAKMAGEGGQSLRSQISPGIDAQSVHASCCGWTDSVEIADRQVRHKGLTRAGWDDKLTIRFAVVGRQLGQKFVVGHARGCSQAGFCVDGGPNFLRNGCGGRAWEKRGGDIQIGLIQRKWLNKGRSMSPTILSRDGKPVLVIGSPGGSRIPTIVLSVVTGVVDYGLDIQQAIDLPRLHQQWLPEAVEVESGAVSPEVEKTLEHEGYTFSPHAPWGMPEGILVGGPRLGEKGTARYYGGYDRRHPGGGAVGE